MFLGVTGRGTVVLEMAVLIALVMDVTRILRSLEAMTGAHAFSSPLPRFLRTVVAIVFLAVIWAGSDKLV